MPSRDSKRNQQGNYGYANGRGGGGGGGGGAPRNHVIPDEPPFTAYIGNAPDSMVQGDFETHLFVGLKVKQVRLVRDRQTDRFRGFAYVDFDDADSLRRAIELDGTFINNRPIRIDVAVRPLGATKSEGFRNKPDFESRNNRRQPSGHDNNRYADGYHSAGRTGNNYHQQEPSENAEDGYHEEYYAERNRRSSGSGKPTERRHSQSQQQKTPPRKVSNNDDVFIAPDTPNSNEDGTDQASNDQGGQTIGRQKSRNWADCPIDETVTEPSPPPSANNTLSGDDFQVVRNKTPKSRNNNNQQPSSARPMGNQSGRGRNYRGGPSPMSGGVDRGYYDQIPPQYQNQSQQFYHHQQAPPPLHMGLSYHNNNHNRHQQLSGGGGGGGGGSRQRLDSNRSNSSRNYNDNPGRSQRGNTAQVDEIPDTSVPPENRPRLQLLPRSQKLSSSTDDNQTPEPAARNANIFGCGKPRDERDPKLAELNKHIEEVVEKEQHVPRTKSTTSNGSTEDVNKPVQILTAAT